VRSVRKLAERTTKAREQLEGQGLRGFIAVNVDGFLADVPANRDPTEVGQAFDKAVARLHNLLPELGRQRALLGIMIIDVVPAGSSTGTSYIFSIRSSSKDATSGTMKRTTPLRTSSSTGSSMVSHSGSVRSTAR
jgi:hypothetical protein